MKHLRIFLIICMMAAIGCLAVTQHEGLEKDILGLVSSVEQTMAEDDRGETSGMDHQPVWQGEASQTLKAFYAIKQAEAVNSGKIKVFIDDVEVLSDDSRRFLYMSDGLEMMASPEALARIFNVSVASAGADTYQVSNGERTYGFSFDSDYVTETDDTFLFPKGIARKNKDVFFALQAVCLAFGHGYHIDMDSGRVDIVRTDSVMERLPVSYDMREDGRAPTVGSQGSLGTCWAFASVAALESSLLPKERLHFSVDHLSMNNGFNIGQNDGGDYFMALSYFASWKGPVNETDDPYGDFVTDTTLTAVKHLQEAVKITSKDYETIKRMIYTCGAVQSSFYSDIEISNASSQYYNMDTSAYYYSGKRAANHDIVIVGWDDDYPRENFNQVPQRNGAFLCQNSWGNTFGKDGYFYISYEDTNIGVYNMVYTSVEAADNYRHIYQSDDLGWLGSIGYNMPSAWFANVYTATGFQKLSAVSFYATDADTYYEVYAVPEYAGEDSFDNAVFLKSGYLSQAGYYTVKLDEEIPVSGQFAVMVYIETKDAVHPVAIEYEGGALDVKVDLSDGHGYISHDRSQWQRVEENYDCNICLKAFTNDVN